MTNCSWDNQKKGENDSKILNRSSLATFGIGFIVDFSGFWFSSNYNRLGKKLEH